MVLCSRVGLSRREHNGGIMNILWDYACNMRAQDMGGVLSDVDVLHKFAFVRALWR